MAIIQTAVIVTGGLIVALFRHRNEKSLFKLTNVDGQVHVLRDSQVTELDIADLVPGDVVILQANQKAYCDMVLVSGSVLVDESALTGESTPIAKSAIDPAEGDVLYGSNFSHDRRHLIQAGTTVLETSATQEAGHANNLAVVLKTGSNTAKGELLRGIFSYQRHQFKFDVEVNLVVMLLLVYAVIIFLVVFFLLHYTAVYGWFYGTSFFVMSVPNGR
jgi:magnesium-transporting ATPase (P-type)